MTKWYICSSLSKSGIGVSSFIASVFTGKFVIGLVATEPFVSGQSSLGLIVGTIIGAVNLGISVDDAGGSKMTPLTEDDSKAGGLAREDGLGTAKMTK